MGGRGTDVAREAASLVLLDDNFASIVRAVRLGRRIFDNLRKSMSYILAVHVPIAGMALLPVLLGWPALLYPMHIALLELIIDPACSLAFENEPAERRRDAAPAARCRGAAVRRRHAVAGAAAGPGRAGRGDGGLRLGQSAHRPKPRRAPSPSPRW